MSVKETLKKIPGVVSVARALRRFRAGSPDTFKSADYWEQRYAAGGNSGAGSYNRLAQFKADFINRFIADHQVKSVIEFGCGDGAQLKLMNYPSYTGIDVSLAILAATAEKFSDDPSKTFLQNDQLSGKETADLSLSLDVIYHLVEDHVFDDYMTRLFNAASRFVIIYSNNEDAPWDGAHVRYRRFTRWIEANQRNFRQIGFERNPYPEDPADPENTSVADFFVFGRN